MKRLSVFLIAAALAACAPTAPTEPARAREEKPAVQTAPAQAAAHDEPDAQARLDAMASAEKAPPSAIVAPPQPTVDKPVEAPPQAPAQASAEPEYREVFPHVRFDAKAKTVQFDGVVPIDAHDAKSPLVFLEVAVCTPDSKEHEALVVTEAKASHVHAAMLLAGLTPGKPGSWKFEDSKLIPVAPEGDALRVTLSYRAADGSTKTLKPEEMIVHAQSGKHLGEAAAGGRWLFAGSQIVTRAGKDWYDADGAGTLIGLTTFGSETIAWSKVISPEAVVEEPAWVADAKTTPPVGTLITVTIQRAD